MSDVMVADAEAFLGGSDGDGEPAVNADGTVEIFTAPEAAETEADKILADALGDEESAGEKSETEAESEVDDVDGEDEEEDAEDGSAEDKEGDEPPKNESQRARLRRERREAQERADGLQAEVAEYDKNFTELEDHAQYFAKRFDEVQLEKDDLQSEVESLRSRLAEYDIPEHESKEAAELKEMKRQYARLEAERTRVEQSKEAQVQAAQRTRAIQVLNEVKAASQEFGVDPKEVVQAMQIVSVKGQKLSPKEAAKRLVTLTGAKSARAGAEAQAAANKAVPNSRRAKGAKSGVSTADTYDGLEGAARFLEGLDL